MPPRPNPHIETLAPYALADTRVPPGTTPVLLAQNEHPLPPSPLAIAAAEAALNEARLYPDPDFRVLRAAIAEVHGLQPDMILCGAGSMELIAAVALAYLGSGRRALMPEHGYRFFHTAARIAGAEVDLAPERGFTADPGALLRSLTPATRVVFIANPGNPTGTVLPADDLRRLRAALPGDVLMVVDEAYGEFAPAEAGPLFDLAETGATVILRTFSKAYGLAAMRVGWGFFPPAVAAAVRRVLNPNNISGPALAAAAAAMRDQPWMLRARDEVAARRDRSAALLRSRGIAVPPSATNFLLLPFACPDAAAMVEARLRAAGIVLRPLGGYGLGHCLRATVGNEADMDALAAALGS